MSLQSPKHVIFRVPKVIVDNGGANEELIHRRQMNLIDKKMELASR